MTGRVIRLIIADDHTLFREGLQALFDSVADVEVVGEADAGERAIAGVTETLPDVVLMDVKMPGISGLEATQSILRGSPSVGVIMVTMLEADDSVFAAMRAGARGYVLKGADQSEMLRAIRAVAVGEALFGPDIAARLMRFFAALEPGGSDAFPELTQRESQVLYRIAQGYNNARIARELGISQKTVRNHVSNVLGKLQVADRAEAIIRARDAGLGGAKPE